MDNWEAKLNECIAIYDMSKKQLNALKTETDGVNNQIKRMMKEHNLDVYESDGYTISTTEISTDKLDEDKLITLIEESCPDEVKEKVIKSKKYLDMDALENLVYNRNIDPNIINECTIRNKPTIRLNIKGNTNERLLQKSRTK